MNDLDFSSLPNHAQLSRNVEPIRAVLLSALAVIITFAALYFSSIYEWVVVAAVLSIFILFVLLVGFLLPLGFRTSHKTQLKLFNEFSRRNGFNVTDHSSDGVNWSEYDTNSQLLCAKKDFTSSVYPTRKLNISGTYRGLCFTIQPTARVSVTSNKKGMVWLGVITIELPDTLKDNVILIDKFRMRLHSATFNYDILENERVWKQRDLSWKTSAYTTYSSPSGISYDTQIFLSAVSGLLHNLSTPTLEISGNTLYLIMDDGLDYSRNGMVNIFNRIDTVANAVHSS